MGFVDIIIEANFNRWDIAALIPLVEGAGGVITSWDGGDCRDGKTILACGDKRVHEDSHKAAERLIIRRHYLARSIAARLRAILPQFAFVCRDRKPVRAITFSS